MVPQRIVPSLALSLLVTAGAAAPPPAQERPAPPIMLETVHVNVVNVEVFVTGPGGRAVPGLGVADFEVLEDGALVPISNFYAAVNGRPAQAVAGADEAPLPPGPAAQPADEQALGLVFFIDNANLTIQRRNAVFEQMRALLKDGLKDGRTQVLLATSAGAVHIRQPFTSDGAVLSAAVDRLEREVGQASGGTRPNSMLMRMMGDASAAAGSVRSAARGESQDVDRENALAIQEQVRSAAEEAYHQTRVTLNALTAFVDSLAGLPGRKALVYVGQGVTMRPAEAMFREWEAAYHQYDPGFNAYNEAGRYVVTSEFNELVRHANAGRVTFYCIDGSPDIGTAATAEQAAMTGDPTIAASNVQQLRQTLEVMSGATGGRTMAAGPNLSETLLRTVDDLQTYYSLGYAAPHSGDGKYHTIKVRVKREGLNVRHREGYLDKTSDERTLERHLSALLFDAASNPLGVAVSVTPDEKQKGDTYTVKVLVTVPLGNLVFLPRQESHEGSVSLWLATRDPQDRLSLPAKQTFPVRIPNEQLQTALGQAGSFSFTVLVRQGPQRVAVTLRDELGQVESTAVATFTAGEPATGAPGPS